MALPPWLTQIDPTAQVQVTATLVPSITNNGVTVQVLNETVYVGGSGGSGTVTITGGTIDGAVVGGMTPAAGTFTALSASSITSTLAASILTELLATLPTSQPGSAGVWWLNGGSLQVSQ